MSDFNIRHKIPFPAYMRSHRALRHLMPLCSWWSYNNLHCTKKQVHACTCLSSYPYLFIHSESHKNYEPDITAHQKQPCHQPYAYHTWCHSYTSSYLLSMNADVLMLSYLLLLSVTHCRFRQTSLPASAYWHLLFHEPARLSRLLWEFSTAFQQFPQHFRVEYLHHSFIQPWLAAWPV